MFCELYFNFFIKKFFFHLLLLVGGYFNFFNLKKNRHKTESSFSHLVVKKKVVGTAKAALWSGRNKSEE